MTKLEHWRVVLDLKLIRKAVDHASSLASLLSWLKTHGKDSVGLVDEFCEKGEELCASVRFRVSWEVDLAANPHQSFSH